MATFQDLMNFAIATGGNNQITDLNSPAARNAAAAAINAEARRQLAQQAGKSAVREARERQWLTGERTAESGFLSPAEEEWVKKNPQLLGSQRPTTRELPGGVTSSTLPDGYTVLTDAQGKIIGTNRPLSSVVPYAGETVEQARAAINRGESTFADRERLGEALRQSIFPQAPARPPIPQEATDFASGSLGPVAGKPQQTPYTQAGFIESLNRSMQPVSSKEEPDFLKRLQKAMGPSFASQPAPAPTTESTSSAQESEWMARLAEAKRRGQRGMVERRAIPEASPAMDATAGGKFSPEQIEAMKKIIQRGTPNKFRSDWMDFFPGENDYSLLSSLFNTDYAGVLEIMRQNPQVVDEIRRSLPPSRSSGGYAGDSSAF